MMTASYGDGNSRCRTVCNLPHKPRYGRWAIRLKTAVYGSTVKKNIYKYERTVYIGIDHIKNQLELSIIFFECKPSKVEALLDSHKNTYSVRVQTGMAQGDGVSSTRENALNSDCRA